MKDFTFKFVKSGHSAVEAAEELVASGWTISEIIAGHDGWLIVAYEIL